MIFRRRGRWAIIPDRNMSHPRLSSAIKLLGELIAFNTQSAKSNLSLVEHVSDYLQSIGIKSATRLDESGEKASLLAHVGPAKNGGVALSGHTDVVDALGQKWQTPPFEITEKDGKLYGRGSCDMKGFIACVLASLPDFLAADLRLPAHVALSRDEELGSIGMKDMLALIEESGLRPAAAIVGEPTCMAVVAGHKAGCEMKTVFTGSEAHSSMPDAGVSAVHYAARFVIFLQELSAKMAASPTPDSPFSPPYGTINVGMLNGGTALNIIAGHCEVMWHYRPLPTDDSDAVIGEVEKYLYDELLPQMRAGGHPAQIVNEAVARYPGLTPCADSPAVMLAQSLSGLSNYAVVPFGADSGHFEKDNIPAVLIGPGDIAQAHKPDEFVEISELEKCLLFLDKLRERLSNDKPLAVKSN